MNKVIPFLSVLVISLANTACDCDCGCDEQNTKIIDDGLCNDFIAINNQPNTETPGYIVTLSSDVNVGALQQDLLFQYKDLNVSAIFPSSNSFLANSGDDTLLNLQCNANVETIEYNSVDAPDLGMSYVILHEGIYNEYADVVTKVSTVIATQNEYESELLKKSSKEVKSVDFDEERLVLIDMGTHNTGGYSINIESLSETSDQVTVGIISSSPGDGCLVTQALTNPYKFIKLNTTKNIIFSEKVKEVLCN